MARLDDLAQELSRDADVLAVLGLGSAGIETDRFDEHSDIDFFVVVGGSEAKARYLDDIGWLGGFGGEVSYSFVNDLNGRKALFADGLFVEYGVFTAEELAAIRLAGVRTVWRRDGVIPADQHLPPAPRSALDTVDFHLNEALTNLFVGLHRQLRGELLTAMRFIQVFAVDRVLALSRLAQQEHLAQPDPFDATRRVEQSGQPDPLPLESMVAGYSRNLEAAQAVLSWLTRHYTPEVVIVGAIEELLEQVSTRSQHGPAPMRDTEEGENPRTEGPGASDVRRRDMSARGGS